MKNAYLLPTLIAILFFNGTEAFGSAVSSGSRAVSPARILVRSQKFGYKYGYGPSIIKVGKTYYAYYCSTGPTKKDWDHVRVASSVDLVKWSKPVEVLTTSGKERANCDPSIVSFDAGKGRYYFLAFSGNIRNVQTVNYIARSKSPLGPFAKLTERGTWETNPRDARTIVRPMVAAAEGSNVYGAGQPSLVVRNGRVYQWYNDTTLDGPGSSDRILLRTSTDMVHWSRAVATNVRNASVDVKYDPARKLYVMFELTHPHAKETAISARTSIDGVNWSEQDVICDANCTPDWSNNIGVSGTAQGWLERGRDLLIAFGAPPNLNPTYNNDCSIGGPKNCWSYWDLAGVSISGAPRKGFIEVPNQGIFFFNGNDAYCQFANMNDFARAGGYSRGTQKVMRLPAARNDGICPVP